MPGRKHNLLQLGVVADGIAVGEFSALIEVGILGQRLEIVIEVDQFGMRRDLAVIRLGRVEILH